MATVAADCWIFKKKSSNVNISTSLIGQCIYKVKSKNSTVKNWDFQFNIALSLIIHNKYNGIIIIYTVILIYRPRL